MLHLGRLCLVRLPNGWLQLRRLHSGRLFLGRLNLGRLHKGWFHIVRFY
jgi:hypothetical protein